MALFPHVVFENPVNLADVGRAIQLALAPVFLLTGIAGLLNVMTGRLARIIDRGRQLTDQPVRVRIEDPEQLGAELKVLERRRRVVSWAITACTLSALLVCTVVAVLFIEVLLEVDLKWLIALLFTTSTFALVMSLTYFLREVYLATHTLRFPIQFPRAQPPAD